jgi:histidine triad (HIT) family protein
MNDSIFTKIIKGEIPSYKIYEDDLAYAFLDIHPVQPGHTLVIPKKQIDRLEELDDETYKHLMKVTKKLMLHLRKTLGTERITLKIEGFDVPHAHVHLIPCNQAKDFWNKVRMDSPIDHPALQEMHKKLAL